jgi:hypothetical protein
LWFDLLWLDLLQLQAKLAFFEGFESIEAAARSMALEIGKLKAELECVLCCC